MIKYFLCSEHGEQFIIKASTIEKAQEHAEGYGGQVIRQLTQAELFNSKPEKGEFAIDSRIK